MPYTPPSQRSPAASAPHSPALSRRSSYQAAGLSTDSPSSQQHHQRPELPRSASYLTRHRRTPSVKTASFANTPQTSEPTPPGTANSETTDNNSFGSHGSIRQSPSPSSDDLIPRGAIMSPPDSTSNSSDDDEDNATENGRGRQLDNLAELEAAISVIEQTRQGSLDRRTVTAAPEVVKNENSSDLTLVIPAELADAKVVIQKPVIASQPRQISHVRSSTEGGGPGFFDMIKSSSATTSRSPSGSEDDGSDGELEMRRKPPMLRKKSGELVRPALRASSSRRRPSSMPGTPTFGGKAVHFDSHLEHVRHFLQVDRPLAVSASSSPVESTYESDSEFPFSSDEGSPKSRSPPFEWEIVVSNFPAETPERLRLPVRVERVFLSADNKMLVGSVAVANLAFNKTVCVRFTLDYWKTTSEVVAEFNNDVRRIQVADGYDRFNFNIKLADQANLEAKTMFFCVKYSVNGQEYWDNNNSTNFQVDFKKKMQPQNGKRGMQGAASRPANSLPRSNKKVPVASTSGRPRSMPVGTFDDFGNGFDSKYDFSNFGQPVHDYLGESPTNPVRLKGVKSAVSIASDSLTRRAPNPNAQAFGNRYDFEASLSAAIQASNGASGERSGIPQTSAKPLPKKQVERAAVIEGNSREMNKAAASTNNNVRGGNQVAKSSGGMDAPRPSGSEKPELASQSYNELLDKYCFFGSVKSSPQLQDGTLRGRGGQYDGNDESYIHESRSPTPSPPMKLSPMSNERYSPPQASLKAPRSGSPAPMTGFVTGMSPVYPYNMHSSFPFNEAHAATAIRG